MPDLLNGAVPGPPTPLRVAFDIGGVLSKHPDRLVRLLTTLVAGGSEVFILTDMPREVAVAALAANRIDAVPPERILCADWTAFGDRCKSVLCAAHGIDLLIDDRPDYVAEGDFVGLVVAPRPSLPYDAPTWVVPDAAS